MSDRHDPGNYEAGTMEWLAACVLEDRKQETRQKRGGAVPWYFLMPTHPAVRVLLAEHKKRLGLPADVAMSDMERTVWELQMLSDDAVNTLAAYYGRRKQFAAQVRRVMDGDVDFEKLMEEN